MSTPSKHSSTSHSSVVISSSETTSSGTSGNSSSYLGYSSTSSSSDIYSFEDTVNKLGVALAKSYHSVWVYFKAGDIEINTGLGNNQYFVSVNNKKNGSGQANSFSIVIAYCPDIKQTDVNYIDRLLYGPNAKSGYDKSDIDSHAVLNECILQYGYNEIGVSSPRYVGQLLDYSVEISNGMLVYTLTGYSGIVAEKEADYTIEAKGSYSADGMEEVGATAPTEAVKEEFENHLSKYGYNIIIDPDTALGKDEAVVIPEEPNTNVFEYANKILGSAVDKDAPEDQDISEKSIYFYTIKDVENEKEIRIMRTNPSEVAEASVSVVFDWMGGFGNNTSVYSGNLVIGFVTEFKGSIPLAALKIEEDEDYDNNKYSRSVNSYGEIVKSKSFSGTVASGDSIESESSRLLSQWATATQYCYKATLTTVGLPCHIPIGEYIRVRPLIYGKEHLTGGIYMITGSEDTIDTSGFITTISLVKVG